MNIFDKIIDKLIRFKYFNLVAWLIMLTGSIIFVIWFANGLYDIIKGLVA